MAVRSWVGIALLCVGGAIGSSCATETPEKTSELIVAVQTDMSIPRDIDAIGVEILASGEVVHSRLYPVGPDRLLIPATLGIVAGEDPSRAVTIRIHSRQKGEVRTLREVATTIPTDRVALLRVPIEWLCDGMAREKGDSVLSTCPAGKTCIAGACAGTKIDSTRLPDFEPEDVFGGAPGPGSGGACFDTAACFAKGTGVKVDLDTCTARAPAGKNVSVALVTKPGVGGICGRDVCYVPLNAESVGGWQKKGDLIELPPAACRRMSDGSVVAVAVTTSCPTKTDRLPPCGAWSSVTSHRASADASTPKGVDLDAGAADALPDGPSDAATDALDSSQGDARDDAGDGGTVSAVIGPSGGVLESSDAVLKIDVPAGALDKTETITVKRSDAAPKDSVGPAYEIGPEGTTFSEDVTLAYALDKAALAVDAATKELALASERSDGGVEILDGAVDAKSKVLTGATKHFSLFFPVVHSSAPDASFESGGGGASGAGGGAGAGGAGGAGCGSLTQCPSGCKDIDTDPANCGYCNNTCAGGETCLGGSCAALCQSLGQTCAIGTDCCSGNCAGTVCSASACAVNGDTCLVAGDCCAGDCPAGNCCSTAGMACTPASAECCAPLICPGTGMCSAAQCSDSVDNDSDSYTDFPGDPECASASDDDESS